MKFNSIKTSELSEKDIDFINSLDSGIVNFSERGMKKVNLWTVLRCPICPKFLRFYPLTNETILDTQGIIEEKTTSIYARIYGRRFYFYYKQLLDEIIELKSILNFGEPTHIDYLLQFSNSEVLTDNEEFVSDYIGLNKHGEKTELLSLQYVFDNFEDANRFYIEKVLKN